MHIIVIILLVIAGIIALLLLLAAVTSKALNVERTITIARPLPEVFNYIKHLKNQDNYSKWGSLDPNMKKEYRGTDATPGFVSAWEGNKKVGKGEQEILKITEGQRLDTELRFIKPFPSIAQAYMTTTDAGNGHTAVSWGFNSTMKYPTNIFKLLMNMENMLGKDFETGLSNLKTLLEK